MSFFCRVGVAHHIPRIWEDCTGAHPTDLAYRAVCVGAGHARENIINTENLVYFLFADNA